MTRRSTPEIRRAFAERLRNAGHVTTDRLADAFAAVPRERFLGPGPWLIRGESDRQGPRQTASDDPALIHDDVAVAVDADRHLYNGQPSRLAEWLHALDVRSGDTVWHIGCGTGYCTALLAALTGPEGRVVGVDIDPALARRAAENLADLPHVEIQTGDGRTAPAGPVDALLVHAGVTHLLDAWLDAAAARARLLVPLTCTIPGMPATLSKGRTFLLHLRDDEWSARAGSMVMIYAAASIRDDASSARLGRALLDGRADAVTRLRRDTHAAAESCWLHGPSWCLSVQDV